MSSEVIAALLGALAAGGFQSVMHMVEAKKKRATLLVAIATEVATIAFLVRAQRYLEISVDIADTMETGAWEEGQTILALDIRENYFAVFDAVAADIGFLRPKHAIKIVQFYAMCKSVIDSHRPDGVVSVNGSKEERMMHVQAAVVQFRTLLSLADEIAQFPARPIPAFAPLTFHQKPRAFD